MTHYGPQEQNTTSHLVNAFKKCTKKAKGGFNLTKIKIPVRQEKSFPTLCSLSNLGSNLIYAR